MNGTQCLTCPRRWGIEIIKAAGLPETLGDLWVAEAMIDGNGVTTFHVDTLAEILGMNELQIGRCWSAGYVPFALAHNSEQASRAVEFMRRKQKALADLRSPEAEAVVSARTC